MRAKRLKLKKEMRYLHVEVPKKSTIIEGGHHSIS